MRPQWRASDLQLMPRPPNRTMTIKASNVTWETGNDQSPSTWNQSARKTRAQSPTVIQPITLTASIQPALQHSPLSKICITPSWTLRKEQSQDKASRIIKLLCRFAFAICHGPIRN